MGFFRRRGDGPVDDPLDGPAPIEADAARRDWAELAPPARLSADHEPTLDTRFDRHLATWQSPAVMRALDHAVRPDGPSGLVLRSRTQSVSAPRSAPSPQSPGFT